MRFERNLADEFDAELIKKTALSARNFLSANS